MSLPHGHPALYGPLELVASNRHLEAVERVLHDIVRVQLIALAQDDVRVALRRLGEEQELCARGCLVAGHEEARGLQAFDAGAVAWGGARRQVARDGVHAMEGAGEDEVVVAGQGSEAGVESAIVDEAASFVDDEQGEDGPGVVFS